ncbi:hypothetical protein ACFZB2_38090 [Streptomyces bobili]|uniref:hypothetical protein n=1 Tax=Streptomyces bobili TaxID=67280 RepID=UPI0036E0032E
MLGFERRTWQLTGDLVVDSSFLRHAIDNPPGTAEPSVSAADDRSTGTNQPE